MSKFNGEVLYRTKLYNASNSGLSFQRKFQSKLKIIYKGLLKIFRRLLAEILEQPYHPCF